VSSLSWRKLARRLLARYGYRISYAPDGVGGNPFMDMSRLLGHAHPLILDVGANTGQSVERFRSTFPKAVIHSFEPSPSVFQTLTHNTAGLSNVHLWNCALGASTTSLDLLENSMSEWTSFLPPGGSAWGQVVRKTVVPVRTLDDFCLEHSIERVDILKSDTQGYDMEVLKGARGMFARNAVVCIYCELIFSELYAGMPSFGDVCNFLDQSGFVLVSLYDIAYENGLAAWTDGLFVNRHHWAAHLEHEGAVAHRR